MKFLIFILLQCLFVNILTKETYITGNNEIQNDNLNAVTEKEYIRFNTNENYEMQLRELSRIKLCETSCKGCCLSNLCVSEFECKFLFYSTFALTIIAVAFGCFSCTITIILSLCALYGKCKKHRLSILEKLKEKLKGSAKTPSIEMVESL